MSGRAAATRLAYGRYGNSSDCRGDNLKMKLSASFETQPVLLFCIAGCLSLHALEVLLF